MQQQTDVPVHTLAQLIDRWHGVSTRSRINPLIVTTGGAVAMQVLPNNPNRASFIIVNLSVNAMYAMIDEQVAAARGIYIPPNGGNMTASWWDDMSLVGYPWWLITPAGASAVLSLEVIIA